MLSRTTRVGSVTRRQALTGAVAVGIALGRSLGRPAHATLLPGASICILTPEAVEGPFYFDPKLVRSDITERRPGAALSLAVQVVEAETCARLSRARVDVWHSDGLGLYSGYDRQETGSTRGKTFLRGTQFTDADGLVRFETIYPGWYPGRTPHIHFKVLLGETDMVTGQLYFPDPVTEHVYATLAPYARRTTARDTFNSNDFIFQKQGGAKTLSDVTEEEGNYRAALVIGLSRGTAQTHG